MHTIITPKYLIDCAMMADNEIALEINGQHEEHNIFTTQQVIETLELLLDNINKVTIKTEVSILICHLTNVQFTNEFEKILHECLKAIDKNTNTNLSMFEFDGIKINDECVARNLIILLHSLATSDKPLELHLVNCFNDTIRPSIKQLLSQMHNIALFIEK